jgi:hypothetical protein
MRLGSCSAGLARSPWAEEKETDIPKIPAQVRRNPHLVPASTRCHASPGALPTLSSAPPGPGPASTLREAPPPRPRLQPGPVLRILALPLQACWSLPGPGPSPAWYHPSPSPVSHHSLRNSAPQPRATPVPRTHGRRPCGCTGVLPPAPPRSRRPRRPRPAGRCACASAGLPHSPACTRPTGTTASSRLAEPRVRVRAKRALGTGQEGSWGLGPRVGSTLASLGQGN